MGGQIPQYTHSSGKMLKLMSPLNWFKGLLVKFNPSRSINEGFAIMGEGGGIKKRIKLVLLLD